MANWKAVLHQDNVRPHTSLVTSNKLLSFGWDLLDHPLYLPDLVQSNYHIIQSMQNSMNRKDFQNEKDIENPLRFGFVLLTTQLRDILEQIKQYKGQWIVD